MKKTLFFSLIFLSIYLPAQVGIGTDTPGESSILDITSTDKGIFVPRLNETQRDEINVSSSPNGLIIYNTTEDCINYWSSTESKWNSICGALGKASIDSCNSYEVVGNYTDGVQLGTSNYINLQVAVKKKGTYTITGTTTNGYNFYANGTFLEDNTTYTVQLMAQGTPTSSSTTTGSADTVTITMNGEASTSCQPTVNVNSSLSSYTMSCKNSTVYGVYKLNQELDTSNYIEVSITPSATGGWSITSDTVDGISFSGSGDLTSASTQTVKIYGSGTPTSVTPKTITLTAETASGKVSCSVTVNVVIPSKTFLQIGTSAFSTAGLYGQNSGSRGLLDSAYNFGTTNDSTVKFEGFTYTVLTGPAEAAVLAAIANNPDIILIGYTYQMTSSVGTALAEYLKSKGVVLIINEFSAENYLFDALYGTTSSVASSEGPTTNYVYKLSSMDDAITNGPFGDMRSKLWASDAGVTHYATGLTASDLIVYTYSNDGTGVVFFRDPGYHLIYNGEGGFIAYNATYANSSSSNSNYPLQVDSNYVPATRTNWTGGSTENARIFANMIAWAINMAEFDGINTK